MHHAHLDKFAAGDSFFHHLDSRMKLLASIAYTIMVVSLPAKAFLAVIVYAVAPFAVLVFSGIPLGFVFRRIVIVSPFMLILAISCVFYDATLHRIFLGSYALNLSGGWLRCFTILFKFTVTMMTLFALMGTTRFGDLLAGLQRMGFADILAMQLGFVYRYLFVLIDRIHHILQARSARRLRSLGFKMESRIAASMIGSLFIESIETAGRIHIAMQARGFVGVFHSIRPLAIGRQEWVFAAGFCLCGGMLYLATVLFLLPGVVQ